MQHIFRLSFFKRFTDSYSHPVNAYRGTIDIGAVSEENAIEMAWVTFAKCKGVSHWSCCIDYGTMQMLR